MKVKDITQFLEELAPLHLQESYDNAGLIVGNREMEVSKVLVSLDATPDIVQEAIDSGYNMVVSHHPIVFSGLKQLNGKNYIERAVIMAVKNDIALYAIHTNLDNVLENGVNQRIAQQLGLQNIEILQPKEGLENIGAGVVGDLPLSLSTEQFLEKLKNDMQAGMVRHTSSISNEISRVAVCGGSGSFLLERAKAVGAQVFVTADFKYHQFFDADGVIMIADIGHFESEQFTIDLIVEQLNKKFSNFAAHCTKIITNPINYF